MAALVEGQQYGLSSQGNYSNNRTLIFVKLTDSALRALEDLKKFKASPAAQRGPTIKFQGNQGVITLYGGNNGSSTARSNQATSPEQPTQKFGFSIANVEADGPQGSFECIQQQGNRTLESLGCMLHKMQIHANEESFDKTRDKMAIVEKESKKNCTKVIKASDPYLGRKVKVKKHIGLIPPPRSSSPPSVMSNPVSNSSVVKPVAKPVHPVNSSLYGGHSKSLAVSKPTGNPDIMRRDYRERVIHLLALRPYKKPELLARLMKDGIKEKDKKGLSNLLNKVAVLKDNTYSLLRFCWNEVQDDWPFYTQQERDQVRRCRPQNLTPPNENEQHSPAALHSSASPPVFFSQQKRPAQDYDSNNPNKKQRISHYNRPEPSVLNSTNGLHLTMPSMGVKTDSPASPTSPHANLNGRSKDSSGFFKNNNSGHKSPLELSAETSAPPRTKTPPLPLPPRPTVNGHSLEASHSIKNRSKQNSWVLNGNLPSDRTDTCKNQKNGFVMDRSSRFLGNQHHRYHHGNSWQSVTANASGSGSRGSTPQSSPESPDSPDGHDHPGSPEGPDSPDSVESRSIDSIEDRGSSSLNSSPSSSEVPDFISKYSNICNGEQRARYKADFNAEYHEYRQLHSALEQVTKKFSALEDSLRNSQQGSDDWHKIRDEILKEYEENRRNHNHRNAKRRFQYLHDKLSHIKRLVVEYDQANHQIGLV